MLRLILLWYFLIPIVITCGVALIWRGLSKNIPRGGWSGEPLVSRSVYVVAGVFIVLAALVFWAFIRGVFGFPGLSRPSE